MTAGTLTAERSLPGRPFSVSGAVEFLITGGLTLVLFPLALLYQNAVGLDRSTYIISFAAFYAAYVINDPHFAVSYLLFYKNAPARLNGTEFKGAQRVRYIVSGFVVPVVLVAWIAFALSTHSAETLGAMVQLMYLLVGWHYVKQGFGVLTVISARHGVRFTGQERWIFLAHCFSGWAYAWASPREMGAQYEEAGVMYTALMQPPYLEQLTLGIFALSTAALLYSMFRRVRRGDAMPPLAASCGFLMSIWLWTVYSNFNPLMAYVIPGLHSLQYWYFVYRLKSGETAEKAREQGIVPQQEWGNSAIENAGRSSFLAFASKRLGLFFLTAVALAWLFFTGIPSFLDNTVVATTARMGIEPDVAPQGLGATPYVAAFAVFINIHHYFMDHVIWRRENKETRYLRS